VYAEGTTLANGEISARGGSDEGDGGFIETSGINLLQVGQAPDVGANNGEGGTWLIDPVNITIDRDDAGSVLVLGALPGVIWSNVTPGDMGDSGPLPVPNELSSFIDLSELEAALGRGNVVISTTDASGDLNPNHTVGGIASLGDISIYGSLNASSAFSLTLNADNDINVQGFLNNFSTGGFHLDAGNDITVDNSITSYGGFIDLDAGNNININANLYARGYSAPAPGTAYIDIDAVNNVYVNNDGTRINARDTVSITANQLNVSLYGSRVDSSNANVDIDAGQDVSIQGYKYVNAYTDIDIDAGRNVYASQYTSIRANDAVSITGTTGNVNLDGSVQSGVVDSSQAGDNISIDAGVNVTLGEDGNLNAEDSVYITTTTGEVNIQGNISATNIIDLEAGMDVTVGGFSTLRAEDTVDITSNNGRALIFGYTASDSAYGTDNIYVNAATDINFNSEFTRADNTIGLTAGRDISLGGFFRVSDGSFSATADDDIFINSLILSTYERLGSDESDVNLIANADGVTPAQELDGGIVRITNYTVPGVEGYYSTTSIRSYNDINISGDGVDIISSGCRQSYGCSTNTGIFLIAQDDLNIGENPLSDDPPTLMSQVTGDINIFSNAIPFGADMPGALSDIGGRISLVSKYNMTVATSADINIAAGDSAYQRTMFNDPMMPPTTVFSNTIDNSILIQAGESNESGATNYFDNSDNGGVQVLSASDISISSGAGARSSVEIRSIGYDNGEDYTPSMIEFGTGEQIINADNIIIDAAATLSSDVVDLTDSAKSGAKIEFQLGPMVFKAFLLKI